MDSHREETNQLQKVIAQKDDDLNRTVHRYEQVLQVRYCMNEQHMNVSLALVITYTAKLYQYVNTQQFLCNYKYITTAITV